MCFGGQLGSFFVSAFVAFSGIDLSGGRLSGGTHPGGVSPPAGFRLLIKKKRSRKMEKNGEIRAKFGVDTARLIHDILGLFPETD